MRPRRRPSRRAEREGSLTDEDRAARIRRRRFAWFVVECAIGVLLGYLICEAIARI